MTTGYERSFKDQLRTLAKELNKNSSDIWSLIVLERFLVRLSNSMHRDKLILKGGVLLAKKFPELGRETRDLDFLARNISNDIFDLHIIFDDILKVNAGDNFIFGNMKITELNHLHMKYPGAEISLVAQFGKSRFPISIDIAFGDIVKPIEYLIPLTRTRKDIFLEKNATVLGYPTEFIFAEKLEIIVSRGAFNSRMKDFYDLLFLIKNEEKEPFQDLPLIINSVFSHRGTPLKLPIFFNSSQTTQLNNLWQNYRKQLKSKSDFVPENFTDAVGLINASLHGKGIAYTQTT
jgi:predicted nucleotidyltransferase component of viral defense system